jgi:hypothetical protein
MISRVPTFFGNPIQRMVLKNISNAKMKNLEYVTSIEARHIDKNISRTLPDLEEFIINVSQVKDSTRIDVITKAFPNLRVLRFPGIIDHNIELDTLEELICIEYQGDTLPPHLKKLTLLSTMKSDVSRYKNLTHLNVEHNIDMKDIVDTSITHLKCKKLLGEKSITLESLECSDIYHPEYVTVKNYIKVKLIDVRYITNVRSLYIDNLSMYNIDQVMKNLTHLTIHIKRSNDYINIINTIQQYMPNLKYTRIISKSCKIHDYICDIPHIRYIETNSLPQRLLPSKPLTIKTDSSIYNFC